MYGARDILVVVDLHSDTESPFLGLFRDNRCLQAFELGYVCTIKFDKDVAMYQVRGALQDQEQYWAAAHGPTNLKALLANHILINKLTPNEHIFSYTHVTKSGTSRRPLTQNIFLARLEKAAREAGTASLRGHAFCIDGTVHIGVPTTRPLLRPRQSQGPLVK